jgi:uncharacterized membrane protein HdeD (DUF308 family)
MVVLGAIILVILAGFILSVIITLLKVLAVVIGVVLVVGGIALMLFGGRLWRRGRWGWGSPPSTST